MNKVWICGWLISLAFKPMLASAELAEVVKVIDGDTVAVLSAERKMTRCRLYGIDAPENGQAYGEASKKSLSDLVYRKILDVHQSGTDKYGRSICRLYLGGVDINQEQIFRGMAWVYQKYSQDPSYINAQASAKSTRLGLWAEIDPVAPWVFRRQ